MIKLKVSFQLFYKAISFVNYDRCSQLCSLLCFVFVCHMLCCAYPISNQSQT
jgi:hypothetical protein